LGQSFVYVTFYNNKRAVFLAIFWPQTHMTFAKKWLKKQHPCCCSDVVRYTVYHTSSIQAAIVIPVKQQQKNIRHVAVRTKCTATENPRPRQDFCW
jgi:hypothetical protein